MKKKILITITAIVLIVAVLATIIFIYKPYAQKNNNDAVSTAEEISYKPVKTDCPAECYTLDLSLDTEENMLNGKALIKVNNESDNPLSEICFRYYAPSLCEGSEIKNAKNTKTGKLYDVYVEEDNNTFVTVNMVGESLAVGKTITIELEFVSLIPEKNDRYGYFVQDDGKLYNLTFCFPQVAFLDNGVWFDAPYFDAGEPTYNEMSDYSVTFTAPKDYVVLGSGSNKTQNGITEINAKNIREMAIVACNFATIETKVVNGVKFNLLKPDYKYENKDLLKDYYELNMTVAVEAVEIFSKKIGSYIYDELDIIPVPLDGFAGMEMPGFIQISTPESDISLKYDSSEFADFDKLLSAIHNVCHEVGHQWFYCGVGNDQYHEAWLDESFTSYLESYYIRNAKEYNDIAYKICKKHFNYSEDYTVYNTYDASYEEKNFYINFPSNDYKPDDYGMIYDYGENFFRKLEETMGEEMFLEMLSDWYNNNLNSVVDGYSFIQHVMKYNSSKEVKNLINQYLSEEHLK